jgi:hypothetical protein
MMKNETTFPASKAEEMSLRLQAELADIEGDKHEAEVAKLKATNAALLEALTDLNGFAEWLLSVMDDGFVSNAINPVKLGGFVSRATEAIRKAKGD